MDSKIRCLFRAVCSRNNELGCLRFALLDELGSPELLEVLVDQRVPSNREADGAGGCNGNAIPSMKEGTASPLF